MDLLNNQIDEKKKPKEYRTFSTSFFYDSYGIFNKKSMVQGEKIEIKFQEQCLELR